MKQKQLTTIASLMPVTSLLQLPTKLFLKAINHPNFSDEEIGVIGDELIKRFPKQEQLTKMCKKLFRKNF